MLNITELNLEKKISDKKELIKIWTPRNLAVIEKITIVKSLFISKFTHIYWHSQIQVKQYLKKLMKYLLNLYGRRNLRNLERKFWKLAMTKVDYN